MEWGTTPMIKLELAQAKFCFGFVIMKSSKVSTPLHVR